MSLCMRKERARPVACDDARAFLAAMLQGEETVIGQDRGIRMAEDAEEAALVLRKRSLSVGSKLLSVSSRAITGNSPSICGPFNRIRIRRVNKLLQAGTRSVEVSLSTARRMEFHQSS